ncbi:MAG TPA: pyruvate kinase [Gaiellaceae bacterium]|jgi:pyruvate kinase|nr:pyruvate kinase [Gaiellaceae bacterium]
MPNQVRRTKIVATIGPGSGSHEMLRALAAAGMDSVRLNFSHGAHAEHASRAKITRAVQQELGRPLALMADLQGPKLRVAGLTESRLLFESATVYISGADNARDGDLVVAPAAIAEALEPGHEVLIDDGLIRLVVDDVEGGRARATVIVGGEVKPNKGVNLPAGVPIPVPSLSEKDLVDLDFALGLGVDYVALSFVRGAADIHELKEIIANRGSDARVIAKIEKAEALDALDEIVEEADAVMVARGDLGVEMGAAMVPLLQKQIILRCLEAGKPVITATQMLESMVEHAEPTRAEASDVANAILDGTSAVMMSAETAVGAYPVEAVRTMDRIARAVEPSMGYRHQSPETSASKDVRRAMSNTATDLAEALGAKAIVVATATGRTASEIARLRPRRPMVGLSHHQAAVQQMALEWGVLPVLMASTADLEDLWVRTIETAREAGMIETGDLVVLIAGTAVNRSGSTNVIKVDTA